MELRVVRERQLLQVRGELGREGIRERVAVEMQLGEGSETREVGRQTAGERSGRQVTG